MEWLILIVLVPAVLVPIVLLYGFAGCGAFGSDSSTPVPTATPQPFDLTATGISTTQIDLAWKDNASSGVTYIVSILTPDGGWNDDYKKTTDMKLEVKDLIEGKFYGFRVRAQWSGGESGGSNLAMTRTLQWETAFKQTLTSNQQEFEGDCLVQRIDRTLLSYTGVAKQIRLTLATGPGNVPLQFTEMSISHKAEPGDDPLNQTPDAFDSRAPIVTFGATAIPANVNTLALPPKTFQLAKDRDLLVVFDVSPNNTRQTRRATTNVGTSTSYRLSNTQKAAEGNRPGPSITQVNSLYLIEKIEVLTAYE